MKTALLCFVISVSVWGQLPLPEWAGPDDMSQCIVRAQETVCCSVACVLPEVATCEEPTTQQSCEGARCYCAGNLTSVNSL